MTTKVMELFLYLKNFNWIKCCFFLLFVFPICMKNGLLMLRMFYRKNRKGKLKLIFADNKLSLICFMVIHYAYVPVLTNGYRWRLSDSSSDAFIKTLFCLKILIHRIFFPPTLFQVCLLPSSWYELLFFLAKDGGGQFFAFFFVFTKCFARTTTIQRVPFFLIYS